MANGWSKTWHGVRLGLFLLAAAWAGETILTQLGLAGTGARTLTVPVLTLLGFVSLSVHEMQALRRSRPAPGAPGTARAALPPG